MDIIRPISKQPIPSDATKVFTGAVFDVWQWQQKLYDGTSTTFEKLTRPDTVVVFPILPDGTIALTKQRQPGKDTFIGGAGGRVEAGEDPLSAAKRELLEETGYEAKEFILWRAEHPTSKIDWVVYIFIAKGVTQVTQQALDGGEEIRLTPVTLDEFIDMSHNPLFAEKEIIRDLLEAKYVPEKREALKKLLAPLESPSKG